MSEFSWIEIGWVGKPHGLNGSFVITGDTVPAELLVPGKPVRLSSKKSASALVEEARWMPKGWVVRLSGISSPEAARRLHRTPIFLEALHNPNEYSPSELESFIAVDAETGTAIAQFQGIEYLPVGPDRWWFCSVEPTGESISWAVPATETIVRKIDRKGRRIELADWAPFRELAQTR